MKFTNVYNIPEWIINKMIQEPRRMKPERISTTSLIHPPRQRTLYIERYDDIVVDVSKYFAMWYGNVLDAVFDDDENAQNKMELEIDGITLVGKWDCMRERIIQDYKFTKVGQTAYGSTLKSWEEQLNVYDYMNNTLNWQRAKGLENHLFYKDHSPVKVGKENGYPKCAWECVKQPQWTLEEQCKFVEDRLRYHKEKPYDCPESERWGSFAVRTKGKQRADRVMKTREECEQWMKEKGRGDYIESRDGLRCRFFCQVSSVCPDAPECIEKYRGKGF